MTKLYAFDRSTNDWLFTGSVEQQLDAISGEPILLRNATNKKIIPEKDGYVRGFVTGEWEYYFDNRGKEYWDENGAKHTITEVGEEVTEGALLEAPVIPPTVSEQTALANAECSKRINAHWNQIGQINASLGIYGADDTAACSAWISSNRAALVALLAREDLIEIDVTDGQYWPLYGE